MKHSERFKSAHSGSSGMPLHTLTVLLVAVTDVAVWEAVAVVPVAVVIDIVVIVVAVVAVPVWLW